MRRNLGCTQFGFPMTAWRRSSHAQAVEEVQTTITRELISTVFLALRNARRRQLRGNAVLVAGPVGSGKTRWPYSSSRRA